MRAAAMAVALLLLSLPTEAPGTTKLSDRCQLIHGLVQLDAEISGQTILTRQDTQQIARDLDRLIGLFASEPLRRSMPAHERSRYSAALFRMRSSLPGAGAGDHDIPGAMLRMSGPQKQALHIDFRECSGPEAEVVTSVGREPVYEAQAAPAAEVAEPRAGSSRRSERMPDVTDRAQGVATASGVEQNFSVAVLVVMLAVMALLILAGFRAFSDDRKSERFACLIPGKVKIGPVSQQAEILNISRNGCKFHHHMPDIVHGRCEIDFGSKTREGRIVWYNQHYAGVSFLRSLSGSELSGLLSGKENLL